MLNLAQYRKIKRLICLFMGHNYDEIALDHGYVSCQRCHRLSYYPEYLDGEEIYKAWTEKKWTIKQFYLKILRKIKNKYYNRKNKENDSDVPF